jgi:hypothetical protein
MQLKKNQKEEPSLIFILREGKMKVEEERELEERGEEWKKGFRVLKRRCVT